MESWREAPRGETQIGQMYFYLMSVVLEAAKTNPQPQPLLGIFMEGELVRYYTGLLS